MNLPQDFILSMENLLPAAEMPAFLASFAQPPNRGIRANLLKVSAEDPIFKGLCATPWCNSGFYYTSAVRPAKNPLYHAGLYYIQEPSAMSAAAILAPRPGDTVLDLCASPGGKTTQMAAAMMGQGCIVANDATRSRIPQLIRNIEMAGIQNALITNETPRRLAAHLPQYFDKILVDAPCSGEGMFRKDTDAVKAWDKNKSARLALIQKEILRQAAKMLAVTGLMAYSTCTFNAVENEDIIADFLENHPNFDIVTTKRIWPHRDKGEGHFVAILRKNSGLAAAGRKTFAAPTHHNKYYAEFCKKYLTAPPLGTVFAHKDRLLAIPQGCPSFEGLNVIRAGLLLGKLQKQRYTPSYALALALKKADFAAQYAIDLEAENPLVQRFLNGETFEIHATDGLNLFCVGGHPIGFAKILAGRLKGRIIA